jgi:O-antigen/teichoic acid export membrane protein
VIARNLAPENYGWFGLAAALAACMGALLQPVPQAISRFRPGSVDADPTTTLARILATLIAALAAVAIVIEGLSFAGLPSGLVLAAWALAATQVLFDFSNKHSAAEQRSGRVVAQYLAKAVLTLIVAVVALSPGSTATTGVFVVSACSLAVATIVGIPTWRSTASGRFVRHSLPVLRAYCVPIALTMLMSALLRWSDRFVLTAWVAPRDFGAYTAIVDFTNQTLGMIASSLFLAWFPRFVIDRSQEPRGSSTPRQYLLTFASILLPAFTGVLVISSDLVRVIFGYDYEAHSRGLLPWVAVAASIGFVRTYVIEIPLHLTGRMKTQSRNVAVAVVITLVVTATLAPRLGIWSAVIAALVAQSVALVLAWYSSRGILSWRVTGIEIARLATCAVLMGGGLSLAPDVVNVTQLAIKVAAGIILYGIAMLLTNALDCRARVFNSLRRHAFWSG